MRKLIFLFLLCTSTASAQTPIRVNLGGPSYTDSSGNLWAPDNGCLGGSTYAQNASAVKGTNDPALFRTLRMASQGGNFVCNYAVPNGNYMVNLYFSELWLSSPGRVFNVQINGSLAMNHFDIFTKAGLGVADIESFTVPVTTSTIAIEMDAISFSGFINAIEIVPVNPPPPATIPFKMSFPGSGTGQGFTISVPGGTAIPSCGLSDGNCSLTIQVMDCNGKPVTAITPGCAVSLSIFKASNRPVDQTSTTILATVSSP